MFISWIKHSNTTSGIHTIRGLSSQTRKKTRTHTHSFIVNVSASLSMCVSPLCRAPPVHSPSWVGLVHRKTTPSYPSPPPPSLDLCLPQKRRQTTGAHTERSVIGDKEIQVRIAQVQQTVVRHPAGTENWCSWDDDDDDVVVDVDDHENRKSVTNIFHLENTICRVYKIRADTVYGGATVQCCRASVFMVRIQGKKGGQFVSCFLAYLMMSDICTKCTSDDIDKKNCTRNEQSNHSSIITRLWIDHNKGSNRVLRVDWEGITLDHLRPRSDMELYDRYRCKIYLKNIWKKNMYLSVLIGCNEDSTFQDWLEL